MNQATDRRIAAALSLCTATGLVAVRWGAGLWGALGTDAPLWGLTTLDLCAGAPPLVPPLYPALVGALQLTGLTLVDAGWMVALAAAALVPAATFWAARTAGALRSTAIVAAVLAGLSPDLGAWAQQLQPDSLASLGMVLLGGIFAHQVRQPDARWPRLSLVILAGLWPLLREHGTALAALIIVVLAVSPRGLRWAGGAALAWWAGPLFVGVLPGLHPLDVPWAERSGGALSALTAEGPDAVPYIRELHREARRAYLDLLTQHDRGGQVRWHLGRSLRLAADGWAVVAVAAVGLLARRSRVLNRLALPILTVVPALLIWSQRRHVMLALPLCLAVLAGCAPAHLRLRQAIVAVVGICVAVAHATLWPPVLRGLQTERPRAEHYAEVGTWICANHPDNALIGGIFQDVGLYCPRPRHDPDGTLADWHTVLVADRPPAPSPLSTWTSVFQGSGQLQAYVLEPQRLDRPCPDGRPAPHTAHLSVGAAHATMVGCGN